MTPRDKIVSLPRARRLFGPRNLKPASRK